MKLMKLDETVAGIDSQLYLYINEEEREHLWHSKNRKQAEDDSDSDGIITACFDEVETNQLSNTESFVFSNNTKKFEA